MSDFKEEISEIKSWIARIRDADGEIGYIDVRAYVWKHWPNLSEAETDKIVAAI